MAPYFYRVAQASFCTALATAAAGAEDDTDGHCSLSAAGRGSCRQGGSAAGGEYYWPKRAGNQLSNSYTTHAAPRNFSVAPAWRWENVDDELVRHTPLIDDELNIYLVTGHGWVRKFSLDGQVLWSWRTSPAEGKIVTSGHLDGGNIFLSSVEDYSVHQAYAYSMDMHTGKLNWKVQLPSNAKMNMDSATVFVANGIYLIAMMDRLRPLPYDANNKLVALNASTGGFMWDYMIGSVVWNFMPSTPGDGTVVFATHCGRAHRLNLATGAPIWVASSLQEPPFLCGTGGGALAPGGKVFHVVTNHHGIPGEMFPGVPECARGRSCVGGAGVRIAYRVSDGKILFASRIHNWGNQYPAVGPLGEVSEAVVAGVGRNAPLVSEFFQEYTPTWLPWVLKGLFFHLQAHQGWLRWLLGFRWSNNFMFAVDATRLDVENPHTVWSFHEEPWYHYAAAGDEERLLRRYFRSKEDPARHETVCGPDSWGIPVISGDGTVYGTSGLTGNIYAIRDNNRNGEIDAEEISVFRTGQAFLNGPALAPGLLVVAPCWGPMYVFRS